MDLICCVCNGTACTHRHYAQIPMFKNDPAAFMLESARLTPSVAGMNPYVVSEDRTHSFRTGKSHTAKAGDCGMITTSGANVDPAVWGEDALEFKTGRPNAERLMTWNNELGDIRSCGAPLPLHRTH